MELSTKNSEIEKDDYDDDDEVVEKKAPKISSRMSQKRRIRSRVDEDNSENSEEVNLLEKNMAKTEEETQEENSETEEKVKENLIKALKKKKPSKKDIVFNKPKPDKTKADKEKTLIFRNMQMAKLQNSHTFQQAARENLDEKFSHGKASQGKDNADEFVSFLGYLRDASFKASQLVAKKEEQQLAKLLKEKGPEKKKGLNVED